MSANHLAELDEVEAIAHRRASRADTTTAEFLTFRLGAEEYGVSLLKVQEIRSWENVKRIANAPAFILGMLNLRGVIVPILDLRLSFGMAGPLDETTAVVILDVASRTVGVVVDSVSDVVALGPDQVKAAPQFSAAVDTAYIDGIALVRQTDGDRMIIVVDSDRLIGSRHMGLFDDVPAGQPSGATAAQANAL